MTVTEIMARGIATAKGIEICSDATYEYSSIGALAKAAISALAEAGFAIVPLEATEQMIANGLFEAESCTDDWTASAACLPGHVWKAMVRAA